MSDVEKRQAAELLLQNSDQPTEAKFGERTVPMIPGGSSAMQSMSPKERLDTLEQITVDMARKQQELVVALTISEEKQQSLHEEVCWNAWAVEVLGCMQQLDPCDGPVLWAPVNYVVASWRNCVCRRPRQRCTTPTALEWSSWLQERSLAEARASWRRLRSSSTAGSRGAPSWMHTCRNPHGECVAAWRWAVCLMGERIMCHPRHTRVRVPWTCSTIVTGRPAAAVGGLTATVATVNDERSTARLRRRAADLTGEDPPEDPGMAESDARARRLRTPNLGLRRR